MNFNTKIALLAVLAGHMQAAERLAKPDRRPTEPKGNGELPSFDERPSIVDDDFMAEAPIPTFTLKQVTDLQVEFEALRHHLPAEFAEHCAGQLQRTIDLFKTPSKDHKGEVAANLKEFSEMFKGFGRDRRAPELPDFFDEPEPIPNTMYKTFTLGTPLDAKTLLDDDAVKALFKDLEDAADGVLNKAKESFTKAQADLQEAQKALAEAKTAEPLVQAEVGRLTSEVEKLATRSEFIKEKAEGLVKLKAYGDVMKLSEEQKKDIKKNDNGKILLASWSFKVAKFLFGLQLREIEMSLLNPEAPITANEIIEEVFNRAKMMCRRFEEMCSEGKCPTSLDILVWTPADFGRQLPDVATGQILLKSAHDATAITEAGFETAKSQINKMDADLTDLKQRLQKYKTEMKTASKEQKTILKALTKFVKLTLKSAEAEIVMALAKFHVLGMSFAANALSELLAAYHLVIACLRERAMTPEVEALLGKGLTMLVDAAKLQNRFHIVVRYIMGHPDEFRDFIMDQETEVESEKPEDPHLTECKKLSKESHEMLAQATAMFETISKATGIPLNEKILARLHEVGVGHSASEVLAFIAKLNASISSTGSDSSSVSISSSDDDDFDDITIMVSSETQPTESDASPTVVTIAAAKDAGNGAAASGNFGLASALCFGFAAVALLL